MPDNAAATAVTSGLKPLPMEEWSVSLSKDGSSIAVGAFVDANGIIHHHKFVPVRQWEAVTDYALEGVEIIFGAG